MRKVLFAALLLLVGAVSYGAVLGTPHDLKANLPGANAQTCVFCHTPHQSGTSVDPLWNHTLSSVLAYGVYFSATLNAAPAEIGGGTNYSNLCMSCHDGTVGIGNLYNDPNNALGAEDIPTNAATLMAGSANLGNDLTNDHPVNFTYDAALVGADGGLVAVASLPTWALKGGTVQCGSCHNPHNNTFFPFLNATNVNSAVCTACHTK